MYVNVATFSHNIHEHCKLTALKYIFGVQVPPGGGGLWWKIVLSAQIFLGGSLSCEAIISNTHCSARKEFVSVYSCWLIIAVFHYFFTSSMSFTSAVLFYFCFFFVLKGFYTLLLFLLPFVDFVYFTFFLLIFMLSWNGFCISFFDDPLWLFRNNLILWCKVSWWKVGPLK